MSTYYARLGIKNDAPQAMIQAAYTRLLSANPDQETKAWLHEAYETLENPDKRRDYDELLRNTKPIKSQKKLTFDLLPDPDRYDHYQYMNVLFHIDEFPFILGEPTYTRGLAAVHHVCRLIYEEKHQLKRKYPKLPKDIKERLTLLEANEKKLGIIQSVLLRFR